MTTSAPVSLAAAIGLGLALTILAGRLRLPGILLLFVTGAALGVNGLGLVDANSLGSAFDAMVEVAIGLLVFEGALQLSRRDLARAPRAVAGLLTIGVVVTGVGVAVAAHYLLGFDWSLAAVLGAILTVTGPTVIQPILRRLPLKPRLHLLLRAEGILIDPIGVLVTASAAAVALQTGEGGGTPGQVALGAIQPVGLGLSAGAVVGLAAAAVHRLLASRGAPREGEAALHAIGACMIAVAAGEWLAHDGGLFAAAACGLVLANLRAAGIGEVHRFGEQIATMLVGMLFILLASRIDPFEIMNLSWRGWAFVALVMFVIRPLSVALSAAGSQLSYSERAFAAVFAPRGIVAASVAALVAARLAAATEDPERIAQAELIETLVFATILATVTWATFAGAPIARLLGVAVTAPPGILLIGAHRLSRELARVLTEHGVPSHLVDSSALRIRDAEAAKLRATRGDATDARLLEDAAPANEIGWMITWTGNEDVDSAAARWGRERFGVEHVEIGLPGTSTDPTAGSGSQNRRSPGGAASLAQIDAELVSGEIVLVAAGESGSMQALLVIRDGGVLSLGDGNYIASSPKSRSLVIGLVRSSGRVL